MKVTNKIGINNPSNVNEPAGKPKTALRGRIKPLTALTIDQTQRVIDTGTKPRFNSSMTNKVSQSHSAPVGLAKKIRGEG